MDIDFQLMSDYNKRVLSQTAGGWPSPEGLRPSVHIDNPLRKSIRKEAIPMDVLTMIQVLGFALTCLAVGYDLGKRR
jgi:hypothetical protein